MHSASVKLFSLLIALSVQVFANDLCCNLVETVRNHSDIFVKFPKETDTLRKKIEDFEPRLVVLEVHRQNLQADVSDLTNLSIAYVEKLNEFLPYRRKTDKSEEDFAQLLEAVETDEGSLTSLDSLNRRKNALHSFYDIVCKTLENDEKERNSVVQTVETLNNTYQTEMSSFKFKISEVNDLEEKQQFINKKMKDVDAESIKINSLLEKYMTEQVEMEALFKELDELKQEEEKTVHELRSFSSKISGLISDSAAQLYNFEGHYKSEQAKFVQQLMSMMRLKETQEEVTRKFNSLQEPVSQVLNEQDVLLKNFKDLSEKLQELMKSA